VDRSGFTSGLRKSHVSGICEELGHHLPHSEILGPCDNLRVVGIRWRWRTLDLKPLGTYYACPKIAPTMQIPASNYRDFTANRPQAEFREKAVDRHRKTFVSAWEEGSALRSPVAAQMLSRIYEPARNVIVADSRTGATRVNHATTFSIHDFKVCGN
jgi:hypothetical protein